MAAEEDQRADDGGVSGAAPALRRGVKREEQQWKKSGDVRVWEERKGDREDAERICNRAENTAPVRQAMKTEKEVHAPQRDEELRDEHSERPGERGKEQRVDRR